MKGGAGSFGFTAITELTHLLETLLDQMRGGKREIEADAVDALLSSVDVLRSLLAAAQSGDAVDTMRLAAICARLKAILDGTTSQVANAAAAPLPAPPPVKSSGWRIRFVPHAHLFMTGNDPLRILSELARLGPCEVRCDLSRLPPMAELEPTHSVLGWEVDLSGAAERAMVDDLFSWVEGDCELSIEPLALAVATGPAVVAEASPEPSAPAAAVATPTVAAAGSNVVPLREERSSAAPPASATESSIRVAVSKVDALINLVGELVITQAMLKQQSTMLDPVLNEKLINGLNQLDRNTRDLQEAVMGVRMMPVDFVFSRFPRMVRDLAGRLGKSVRMKTIGEGTELDKGVIEKISDPLVHLVRNSIDHGLELPDERIAAGKDETGTITLSASHQGGHIVIEVADDGRGLDRERIVAKARERGVVLPDVVSDAEAFQLILLPGLSTAKEVTDVSGRGVGMDVVKKNIIALGGTIEIASKPGLGTRITIRLPLTLAILDGMTVAVGDEIFIAPLSFVVESLQLNAVDIKTVSGNSRLLRVRGEYVPLLSMAQLFGARAVHREGNVPIAVIVEGDGRRLALEVDELVGQQQVVVKSLENNYRRIHGISGATILGDGRVALIIDVGGLARGLVEAA
jgi:two-component system chemotaxis sensor kinase CheA